VPVKTNPHQSGQNSPQVKVDGVEIDGRLTIGKLSMRVDAVYGNVVSLESGEMHFPKPRSQRVSMLPHPFPNLIGRLTEIKNAIASLESNQSVEFYGGSSLGKSVLLRHLTYFIQPSTAFPDGAVYFDAVHQPVTDLLQSLFDIFYETDITYKPTPDEINQALENKQVLIILDDKNLTSDDIKQLQKSLPKSLLILASLQPRLETAGYTTQLSGFGLQETLVLMAQLQYAVTKEEYPAVEALINLLDGNPWLLLLAITSIKKNVHTLAGLVLELQPPATKKVLIEQVLATLPQSHQRILAVLAAVNGVALVVEQIAAISGIGYVKEILPSLVEWNLVEVDCSNSMSQGDCVTPQEYRYRTNGTINAILRHSWDLTASRNSASSYFITWAEQYRSLPSLLCSETDAIMELLLNVTPVNWENVLRLVKAVESSLCLGKQWGLWEQVLQTGLQAAKALDDKPTEAWILHQLGSRALCLSQIGASRGYLSRALQIRQSLGDENGIKITNQNFKLLTVVPSTPETDLPQVAFQYKPTNPRLKPNLLALISLLSLGLAGSLAFYITQLKTPPKSNPVTTQKLTLKPNKITLSINPQNLNFDNQAVNTRSQKQNVTIINKGSTLLQLGDIERLSNQGDFEISSNSCPSNIPPNRSCNISIIFAPVGSGKHQADLPVTDSDGKTIGQILIEGVATEQQEPFTDIAPAPEPLQEQPLQLPQPRLFPPQIPQQLSTPASTPKPPNSIKPRQFPTSTPELTPNTQPTPQVTQFPQIESTTQPTPEVTQSPPVESTTQPTPEVKSPSVESTTQPTPQMTQFPQIQSSDQPIQATQSPSVDNSVPPH
jgi:hypothetical protein